MNELNEPNSNKTPLIVGIVALVLIVLGVVFFKNRQADTTARNATTTDTYTAPAVDYNTPGTTDTGTYDASGVDTTNQMGSGTNTNTGTNNSDTNTNTGTQDQY